MIPLAVSSPTAAHQRNGAAVLFLNGLNVGMVQAGGGDTSWGFGTFSPNESFGQYAPLFGAWSVLMHAEDDAPRLSREAVLELARFEEALDAIKVHLFFPSEQQTVRVAQLTIEGNQLEWKEY
jgi:hypothetical protein